MPYPPAPARRTLLKPLAAGPAASALGGLAAADRRLTLRGDGLHGRGPVHFTHGQLRDLPSVTRTALIECAGNGRGLSTAQQDRPVTGTAWTPGAVGAARRRGVRLAEVLRRAGIAHDAVDLQPRVLDDPYVFGGVDFGRVRRPRAARPAPRRPRRDGRVRWSVPWRPHATGRVTLLSRTTDGAGNTRPAQAVHNTRGYLLDAVVRHPVTVVRRSGNGRTFV
ncbi:hypothetical protein GCM10010275_52060 [Streptomyces litmocidini]|uniref:molybdopterin-dependent oxidoreductase n=1 Tax=Streptomyces litmocidini TaxID=67318 RepID=UPI00167D4B67|nr:molybdopterin-dependent oxidoreductase [Streptomyces litmocidini]GGV05866.1 hypothetical protein GCM10010275_52060 [Streptomyces litmocidini]